MFCRLCGKSISEEIFSEFDGKCLECVKKNVAKFSTNEERTGKDIKKCRYCDSLSIDHCRGCDTPVCFEHAQVHTKWGDKTIDCYSCMTRKYDRDISRSQKLLGIRIRNLYAP